MAKGLLEYLEEGIGQCDTSLNLHQTNVVEMSIAISLKRIADVLEHIVEEVEELRAAEANKI